MTRPTLAPLLAIQESDGKAEMKIGEAADRVGLPIKTVRYYADIGLVEPASRSASGYRDYGEEELKRLRLVSRARNFGFSIDDCRALLALLEDPVGASDALRGFAVEKRAELDRRLTELMSLRSVLDFLIERPDEV